MLWASQMTLCYAHCRGQAVAATIAQPEMTCRNQNTFYRRGTTVPNRKVLLRRALFRELPICSTLLAVFGW